MAVIIPIVTEFAPKGIKRAIREFKQLETSGQRAAFILKKGMQGVALGAAALGAAVAGAAAAAWNFAKAAAEDETSAALLARQLKATTKATDDQIKSVEEWITQLQLANGIADSDLRPNLAKLVRATKSITKGQELLSLALDVSAGSGRDLDGVVTALVRAYGGNLGGLTRLGIALDKTTIKNKDFKKAQEELGKQFGGAAATKAATFQGTMDRLGQAFSEIKESLGYFLLPFFEKLADVGMKVAEAFGKRGLAGAIKEVKKGFMTLFYDELTGELNDAGKQLNALIGTMNDLKTAGLTGFGAGFGAVLLGSIGALGGPVTAVAAGAAGAALFGGAGYGASKIIGIPGLPELNPNRSQTLQSAQYLPRGGQPITVNVYGGDPKQVVKAIRDYSRSNGKVPMRVLNLGS